VTVDRKGRDHRGKGAGGGRYTEMARPTPPQVEVGEWRPGRWQRYDDITCRKAIDEVKEAYANWLEWQRREALQSAAGMRTAGLSALAEKKCVRAAHKASVYCGCPIDMEGRQLGPDPDTYYHLTQARSAVRDELCDHLGGEPEIPQETFDKVCAHMIREHLDGSAYLVRYKGDTGDDPDYDQDGNPVNDRAAREYRRGLYQALVTGAVR